MSHCRWSSDNYRCDLYIYESEAGYELWIAGSRYVGEVPVVSWKDLTFENGNPNPQWIIDHQAQMDFLDKAETIKIDLPYAGEHFLFEFAEDLKTKVLELRNLGYNFPDYVLQAIDEDIEDETNNQEE